MRAELLEQLLIDRSLGQLPPEVAALLDAYLAADPAAAAEGAAYGEAVSLARRAIEGAEAAPMLPAFDRKRVDAGVRRRAWRQRGRIALALAGMAACVAVGFVGGRGVGGFGGGGGGVARVDGAGSGSPAVAETRVTRTALAPPASGELGGAAVQATSTIDSAADATAFWSVQRLRALAERNDVARRPGPAVRQPLKSIFAPNGG
jgi:anti-sigma factor RsiW